MAIKIRGLDKIIAKSTRLNDFQRWASDPMEETSKLLQKRAKIYPSPLSNQKYRRTFKLRDSMKALPITTISNGVRGGVTSIGAVNRGRRYEKWVKVFRFQARIHHNRWGTEVSDWQETGRQRRMIWNRAIRDEIKR